MERLRSLGLLVSMAGAIAFAWAVFFTGEDAQARPQYLAQFSKQFPDVKEANTAKCNTCHVGKEKKDRNDFGKALAKELGKDAKTKDAKIIESALKKTADQAPFKDRLKGGKLPVGE